MLTAALLIVGVVLLAMGLAERHVTRLPMSPATVYLLIGWLAGELGRPLLSGSPWAPRNSDVLMVVTEVAVLSSLFAVGLRLQVPPTLKGWRVAAVLASSGMLATIGLAALAAWWLLPPLDWVGALLLGAILAPTDPVLASEVQIQSPNDRDAVRLSLTAEAGLNDGTALPVVMLGLGLLGVVPLGAHGGQWLWRDLLWPIAGGLVLGWLFGRALRRVLLTLLCRHHSLAWDELLYLGIVIVAYGLARWSQTSAFLLVFAAALGLFRPDARLGERMAAAGVDSADLAGRLLAFGHRCERLIEVGMVLILGVALAWIEWSASRLAFAALLAFAARPLAVYLCISKRELPVAQRRLVAWFGIRGVGSLFYLAFVIEHGVPAELAQLLVDAALPAIALSIIVHGVSATPLMMWYRQSRIAQRRGSRRRDA